MILPVSRDRITKYLSTWHVTCTLPLFFRLGILPSCIEQILKIYFLLILWAFYAYISIYIFNIFWSYSPPIQSPHIFPIHAHPPIHFQLHSSSFQNQNEKTTTSLRCPHVSYRTGHPQWRLVLLLKQIRILLQKLVLPHSCALEIHTVDPRCFFFLFLCIFTTSLLQNKKMVRLTPFLFIIVIGGSTVSIYSRI